jgi:hypothetical protein
MCSALTAASFELVINLKSAKALGLTIGTKKPRRLHDYYCWRRREPDFFLCSLELRLELFHILEGQGRAFRVSRPWALVDEG